MLVYFSNCTFHSWEQFVVYGELIKFKSVSVELMVTFKQKYLISNNSLIVEINTTEKKHMVFYLKHSISKCLLASVSTKLYRKTMTTLTNKCLRQISHIWWLCFGDIGKHILQALLRFVNTLSSQSFFYYCERNTGTLYH